MSRSSSNIPFITVILAVEAVTVVALVVATATTATTTVVKGDTKSPTHINTCSNTPTVCYRV